MDEHDENDKLDGKHLENILSKITKLITIYIAANDLNREDICLHCFGWNISSVLFFRMMKIYARRHDDLGEMFMRFILALRQDFPDIIKVVMEHESVGNH